MGIGRFGVCWRRAKIPQQFVGWGFAVEQPTQQAIYDDCRANRGVGGEKRLTRESQAIPPGVGIKKAHLSKRGIRRVNKKTRPPRGVRKVYEDLMLDWVCSQGF